MRGLGRAPVVGFLLLGTACGGPEFTAELSDGGGGGNDATVTPDAGTTPPDAGGTDGEAKDAGPKKHDAGETTDAAGGDDAGGGSGDATAGDAGPSPFACPSADPTVVFCSGFDGTKNAPWDWKTPLVTVPKGSDTADTTNFLSAPNGFAAATQALLPGDTYTLAALGEPFITIRGQIEYSFHMFVKTYDTLTNPPITVSQLIVSPGTPASLTLQLIFQGGQLKVGQVYGGADGGEQAPPPAAIGKVASNQWVALDMLLDRRASSWTVVVTIDGGSKFIEFASTTPSDQNLEADLGIIGLLPTTSANAITFDNVTVRAF